MCTMSFAAPIFALAESDQPMLLWYLLGGLAALGAGLHYWIEVVMYFKGRSIDPSSFITRAEFSQAKAERDAQLIYTVTEIRTDLDRVETLMTDLSRDLPAIHRALGRLEGHDDAQLKRPR